MATQIAMLEHHRNFRSSNGFDGGRVPPDVG
jgi:hypothetical protein